MVGVKQITLGSRRAKEVSKIKKNTAILTNVDEDDLFALQMIQIKLKKRKEGM